VKIITVTFVMFFTDINHALMIETTFAIPACKIFLDLNIRPQFERCSPQQRSGSTTKPDQFIEDF
jgi:hypothetical protein